MRTWSVMVLGSMLVVLMGICVGGCRKDREELQERVTSITLSEPKNLWPLQAGDGFYQLWLGRPQQPPPAGTNPWDVPQAYTPSAAFRTDAVGNLVDLDGAPRTTWPIPASFDIDALARARLTVEPPGSTPPDPLDPFPRFTTAAGSFLAPGGTVTVELTALDAEVTVLPLAAVSGSFQLLTPTTPNPNDESLGVWFVAGTLPTLTPSLDLDPDGVLASDRIFEGWVAQRNTDPPFNLLQVHSTGRFRRADAADHDGPGPGGGTEPAPMLPGQDLLTTLERALNVDPGWETLITLEPDPDPAPSVPTGLRVLRGPIALFAPVGTSLPLQNVAERNELPGLVVQVRR